jgi:hypothetical protein
MRVIAHDPFARQELVRRNVPQGHECFNCGQPARYEYAISCDASTRNPFDFKSEWPERRREFCSVGCYRSYWS